MRLTFRGTAEDLCRRLICHPLTGKALSISEPFPDAPRILNGSVLNARRACGIYALKKNDLTVILEVLPKGWKNIQEAPGSLDTWLGILQRLSSHELISIEDYFSKQDFASALERGRAQRLSLFEFFVERTLWAAEGALRNGLPNEQLLNNLNSTAIKGRINWNKQISSNGPLQHKHEVIYRHLTNSSKMMVFLHSGLEALAAEAKGLIANDTLIRRFRHVLGQFADVPVNRDFQSQKGFVFKVLEGVPPKYARFEQLLKYLAKWIYSRPISHSDNVSLSLNGVHIDLNKAFEKWCRSILGEAIKRSALLKRSNVQTSAREQVWNWGSFKANPTSGSICAKILKPDMLIFRNNPEMTNSEVLLIGDAKYKDYTGQEAFDSEDAQEGIVSRNDFFQMVTYKFALQQGLVKDSLGMKYSAPANLPQGPRLVVFYPAEEFDTSSQGFYGEEGDFWTLKIVGVPFNAFLRGEDSLDYAEISGWLEKTVL